MKILQLGKFYPIRGGVEKVMYDLTLGLAEKGFFCDMLCASTENYPEGIITLNVRARVIVVRTRIKMAGTMIAPDMISVLRKIANTYDIIHIHHPDPMACIALRLSGYKGKVVLHWHADILKQKKLLRLYKPLQSWLIKRSDIILGTSPVYVKESSFLQDVQHKLDYVPIGVSPTQADNKQIQTIRNRFQGKRIIFSLGRLVEYKGYKYLIRAAADLPNSYQIVIGGSGPLFGELSRLIDELGLAEKVTLLGFVPEEEIYAYFAAADVFCLSSISKAEAFAIVQVEAMAMSKPIISTKISGSGVNWVNKHGVSGLIVEPENAKAIASAINQICEDKMLRKMLELGSKERYIEFFTTEKMIKTSLEMYQRISGDHCHKAKRQSKMQF